MNVIYLYYTVGRFIVDICRTQGNLFTEVRIAEVNILPRSHIEAIEAIDRPTVLYVLYSTVWYSIVWYGIMYNI